MNNRSFPSGTVPSVLSPLLLLLVGVLGATAGEPTQVVSPDVVRIDQYMDMFEQSAGVVACECSRVGAVASFGCHMAQVEVTDENFWAELV